MEQIQVILYALLSFFGVENSPVAADTTIVTINPQTQTIEIIQQQLFAIIKSPEDKALVLKHLKTLNDWKDGEAIWIEDLKAFPEKTFALEIKDTSISPRIRLKYSAEEDLRNLGIWYNESKNEFSVNHVPSNNLSTIDGELRGNYWVFKGEKDFTFTLEPFLELPEKFKEFKISIDSLLLESNKED